MSGRDGRDGLPGYAIVRGALVVVVIAALLGVFGASAALKRPDLKPVNWLGLAVMLIGLGLALAAPAVCRKVHMESKAAACRLIGVLVCGVGAIMVICL